LKYRDALTSILPPSNIKPRSSKCASSSSTPVSVAKVPDRKDAYLIDNESFQTPPYIEKERADCQERKAKLAAIKALKATKKKKKETKKSRRRKS
jgi:Pyruvate/2-oxoacid:ferredoxin oxidoreductase gamma subunit